MNISGNIRQSLRDSLRDFFQEESDDSNKEALLETKHYTVALWKDDKAYYVFDPRPRDKNGEVIGRSYLNLTFFIQKNKS